MPGKLFVLGHELGGHLRDHRGLRLLPGLRQAEIEHLNPALISHHDVGWLEVAMDDALLVRCSQGIRQVNGNLEDPLDRQITSGDHPREGLSLDQLHGEKLDPVRLLHRVNRHDVRMVEGRE